jgi:hypothetical protein
MTIDESVGRGWEGLGTSLPSRTSLSLTGRARRRRACLREAVGSFKQEACQKWLGKTSGLVTESLGEVDRERPTIKLHKCRNRLSIIRKSMVWLLGLRTILRDFLIRGMLSIRKLRPLIYGVLVARGRESGNGLRRDLSVNFRVLCLFGIGSRTANRLRYWNINGRCT